MLKHLQSIILDEPIADEIMTVEPYKLMQLMSHTHAVGNWRLDVATGKVWWSPRVYEIHGLEPSEDPIDIEVGIRSYHANDARTVAWLVMHAIENKVGFTFVLRLLRSDGVMRLVQSAASVDVNANGEVETIYGIFKDVTDRFTEKDVADGRGRLVRSIISHSPSPIIVLDKAMRYLELSQSWIEFYDLQPAKTLIGRSHYEVMPNLPSEFREHNQRALDGEIIHSRFSYAHATRKRSTQRGAVIFPWRGANDEVGGIIIMLTPADRLHAQDATLEAISSLYRPSDLKKPPTQLPMVEPARSQRVRGGAKW